MVYKRPFVSDTWKLVPIHYSGLPGDRALSKNNSYTQKMFLERPFIGDIWKTMIYVFIVQVSQEIELWVNMILSLKDCLEKVILLRNRTMSQNSSFATKIVLKRPFVNDTGEDFTLHIHCWGYWET